MVAVNNTADNDDKEPDRDPSLSHRLSETQQGSRNIAENSHSRDIPTSLDNASMTVIGEHVPNTHTLTTNSDHPGIPLTEDIAVSDSTSGDTQMVNGKGTCRIESDVGNHSLTKMALNR